MKIFSLVIFLSSSFAFAGNYQCQAKANAARGFPADFSVTVSPAQVGGKLMLETAGKKRELGTIGEMSTVTPSQKQMFDATLGLIWEEDVSGLKPADLNRVNAIEIYRADIAGGDEALVYRLFEGSTQIGGTFLLSGMGTACL